MGVLEWSPTTADDIASLVRLGTACLERDGGLPDLAERLAGLSPAAALEAIRRDAQVRRSYLGEDA